MNFNFFMCSLAMLFIQRAAVPCFNCEYCDKNKTIFLKEGMNCIDLHIHRSSDPPNYRSTDPLSSDSPIYGSTDYTDHRPCDPLIHRFTNLPIHSSTQRSTNLWISRYVEIQVLLCFVQYSIQFKVTFNVLHLQIIMSVELQNLTTFCLNNVLV